MYNKSLKNMNKVIHTLDQMKNEGKIEHNLAVFLINFVSSSFDYRQLLEKKRVLEQQIQTASRQLEDL